MDLHSGQTVGYFDIPVDHVYGETVILDYLASKRIATGDLVVVSPDVGGVARARAFAKKLNDAPLGGFLFVFFWVGILCLSLCVCRSLVLSCFVSLFWPSCALLSFPKPGSKLTPPSFQSTTTTTTIKQNKPNNNKHNNQPTNNQYNSHHRQAPQRAQRVRGHEHHRRRARESGGSRGRHDRHGRDDY